MHYFSAGGAVPSRSFVLCRALYEVIQMAKATNMQKPENMSECDPIVFDYAFY
jgi:hypothetical protein